jgi:1,4-alpha-glucan branching enzyme
MIFAGMSSSDSDSSSLAIAASNKILVPGGQGDGSLSLTDQLENPETVLEDSQVCCERPTVD